jgi:hypothetical protein
MPAIPGPRQQRKGRDVPEDDESDVTMSDQQKLITRIVAAATINRWSYAVDFTPHGETEIRVMMPSEPAPDAMPHVEF